MGWTVLSTKPSSVRQYLCSQFTQGQVLDFAQVGLTEAYAAYQTKAGDIVALVWQLRYYSNGEFGYKDMDETSGPCQARCPERILDKLTATDSEWANLWRQRCRRYIEQTKTVRPGVTIKFETPLSFSSSGIEQKLDTFVFAKGNEFLAVYPNGEQSWSYFKISNWQEKPFVVLA